jgi:hypothetical protein
MVSAGLAQTEGRVTFGVSDLLRALARDPELSFVLGDLGVDVELPRIQFGEDPPPAREAVRRLRRSAVRVAARPFGSRSDLRR